MMEMFVVVLLLMMVRMMLLMMVEVMMVVVPGERVDSIRYQHSEPYGRPVWRCSSSSSSVPATLGRTRASSDPFRQSERRWDRLTSGSQSGMRSAKVKYISASVLAQISVEKPHWIVKSDRSYSISSRSHITSINQQVCRNSFQPRQFYSPDGSCVMSLLWLMKFGKNACKFDWRPVRDCLQSLVLLCKQPLTPDLQSSNQLVPRAGRGRRDK